ncbi:MAG: hypothetical protein ACK55I_23710, partial [bacterium]
DVPGVVTGVGEEGERAPRDAGRHLDGDEGGVEAHPERHRPVEGLGRHRMGVVMDVAGVVVARPVASVAVMVVVFHSVGHRAGPGGRRGSGSGTGRVCYHPLRPDDT